jgi:hypothetical protein
LATLVVAASLVATPGCSRGPSPAQTADTIFSGGPILTINDAQPTAEAVAVKDGRILAVGARAEIAKAHQGPKTAMVDLGGRTMLPGFIDAHSHAFLIGFQALAANLLPPPDGGCTSIAGLQEQLRKHMNAPITTKSGWLLGFGYDDSQLAERRHPTRQELDAVSADKPVFILHQSAHLASANTKALELAGITKETKDPPGGVIRREQDGTPNGVLEESAMYPVMFAMPKATLADRVTLVEAGQNLSLRYGFTTIQEGAASPDVVEAEQAAGAEGRLKVDLVAYPNPLATPLDSLLSPGWNREYRNRFRIGGIKIVLDGSPQGKTAWLTQPYKVPPPGRPASYAGYASLPDSSVQRYVDFAFEHKLQVLAHCNGDAAADQLIAAVRKATATYGPADRRTVMIHSQTVREDQLDAMKDLGIIPSFFTMHTYYWGDWHRDETLGPERAMRISPLKSALDRGMKFTNHHDGPVGMPSSIMILASAVNRTSRTGQIIGEGRRVDVMTALKALTLWGAYQYFEEDRKGSIEPGKLADFVVLSDNPTTVAPEKLFDLKVLETIKEGKSVYKAQ